MKKELSYGYELFHYNEAIIPIWVSYGFVFYFCSHVTKMFYLFMSVNSPYIFLAN